MLYTELDRETGAAGIPTSIWQFCTGTGRDLGFSQDFSQDFSKINSVSQRKFESKIRKSVNIFLKHFDEIIEQWRLESI